MTRSERHARAKMNLLQLGQYLNSVSEACRVTGVSRQHFYDLKKAYDEGGLDALKERSRRGPNVKNRVAPEIESAAVALAHEQPAWGQFRVANELRRQGLYVSSGGVRSIWLRHELETFQKRLKRLEERSAQEGLVYTEAQVQALERAQRDKDTEPGTIETEHPGYLMSQDTFYVGCLKGVGRIYQQTASNTGHDVDKIAAAIRAHWQNENSLHWVLDITFYEDQCRVRLGYAAENFSTVRKLALNALKANTSKKASIRRKRKIAGWDNDYLREIFIAM